jgi:hypothetical protein
MTSSADLVGDADIRDSISGHEEGADLAGDAGDDLRLAAGEFEGVQLPGVALVEVEYLRAVADAELRWVTATIEALRDGSLTWDSPEPAPSATT